MPFLTNGGITVFEKLSERNVTAEFYLISSN